MGYMLSTNLAPHPFLLGWLKLNLILLLDQLRLTLDYIIHSGNFSVRDYLPLIRKDLVTQKYGLAVYMKGGLSFAQELSLENSVDSYVFEWRYFTKCLSSFFSIDHLLDLYALLLILFHLIQIRFF